jgi:hypothetical protein
VFNASYGLKRTNEEKRKEGKAMRKGINLLVVLGMLATEICITGVAQGTDEILLQVRSLQVGDEVPMEVCDRGWDFLGLAERELPEDVTLAMLDAVLWANQTRAKDSKVVNPEIRLVGTASACAWLSPSLLFANLPPATYPPVPIDPKQPFPSGPIYGEMEIGDLFFPAGGECLITSNTIPELYLALGSCNLLIPPDEDQGRLGGNVSSNSLFNVLGLPGYNTGSFWTVRIYTE